MADTRSTTGLPDRGPVAKPPERVGRYELVEPIGEGGMGVVWSARDPELGRIVAVKLLKHATSAAAEDRLRREAKSMARLVHPNVIRVYDVGVAEDGVFLAMEYVAGGTLKDWLAAKPRGCDEILATFVLAGEGLAAAHAIGLVHRDVKPSNVLVGKDGRVLVTDFGLARSLDGEVVEEPSSGSSDPLSTITRTGGLVGTPAYMAPEQRALAPVDARSDQFSFAVALWSALYGAPPFADPASSLSITPPQQGSKVPAHVRASLERALAIEPAQRFATMRELLSALTDDPRKRRRRLLLAAGATVAIGAAAIVWWQMPAPADACAGPDRFAGLWDDGTRQAIAGAFARTHVPYADVAFQNVAALLDARRATWSALALETCHDAQRSNTLQRIMKPRAECLEQRFADLAAYIAKLREADASTVKNAVQATTAISDPNDCDNPALDRVLPRPDDVDKQQAIDAVERDLASVRADLAAGHYKDAFARTTAAVERARKTAYPPVLASALAVAGRAAGLATEPAQAEKQLEEALLVAETARDDTLRFDCEVMLVKIVGQDLERVADGERHAQRAEALLTRIANDPGRAGLLARSRAGALWWAGRYADARVQAQKAVDLLTRVPDNAAEIARALHMRAIIEQEIGEPAASVATEDKARELAIPVLGETHPTIANMWNTSGGSLRQLKRYADARAHLGKSLAIAEANGPADSPQIADAVQNLATVFLDENKPADAIPLLERAVAISTASNGPEHSRTADVLELLADALSHLGRADAAVTTFTRSIEIHRARLGPDSPATASSVRHLGYHYLRAHKFAEARAQFAEAIRALEVSQGKTSHMLLKALIALGDAELGLANKPAARAAYQRARSLTTDDDKELREQLDKALAK